MMKQCNFCKSEEIEILPDPSIKAYSTGDRRRISVNKKQISRVICKKCGGVSFYGNDEYKKIIDSVFDEYDVLTVKSEDLSSSRLEKNILRLANTGLIKNKGKILDFGCGGGEFLKSWKRLWPEWMSYGYDIGKQFREYIIETGSCFLDNYNELEKFNDYFDVVCLNSVLYGIEDWKKILTLLHRVLSSSDGILLVYEIDPEIHPYTIYAIDNRNIMYREFCKNYIEAVGFSEIRDLYLCDEKEYFKIFRRIEEVKSLPNSYHTNKEKYLHNIEFIDCFINKIKKINFEENIWIMGTSIAGIWCLEIIEDINPKKKVEFLEEDPDIPDWIVGTKVSRISDLYGKSGVLLLPFPEYIAKDISVRLRKMDGMKNIEFIY